MNILYIIKKCKRVGLLFFIVSVANAAPTENNEGYFDNQLEAFALVIDEEAMGSVEPPVIPHEKVEGLQNSAGKSKEQKKSPNTQLDKLKSTLGDSKKDHKAPVISSDSTKEVDSSRVNVNTLKNDFLFNNINTSSDVFNQNLIFNNDQDLKMLAHDIFGKQALNDVLMAREEVKMLLKLTDTWIKEVLFDRRWQLEDSIYGSAAIRFIKDSSLIHFLKKLDINHDGINRTSHYSEQHLDSHNSSTTAIDSELVQGNYGILEFWDKYSGVFIYLVLPIIILREVYKLVSKTSKSKNRKNSRRGSSRNSKQAEKKERISEVPLSVHDGIASNTTSNSGIVRREKYKYSSRRQDQSSKRRAK